MGWQRVVRGECGWMAKKGQENEAARGGGTEGERSGRQAGHAAEAARQGQTRSCDVHISA
eukprot:6162896-Pyramimonas_sp.AAC.1